MNREIVPGGLYPLQGDVQSTAGNNKARVIGIQNIPVSNAVPNDGDVLTYVESLNEYVPEGGTDVITVNNIRVSVDDVVFQNGILAFGTTLGIEVNGVPV